MRERESILRHCAAYLEAHHGTDDLDWCRFLSPFYRCFSHYFEEARFSPITRSPHAVNDFIDLFFLGEKISGPAPNGKVSTELCPPHLKYVENFRFPYSPVHKIAHLSFLSPGMRYLFLTTSLLTTRCCELDYVPTDVEMKSSPVRHRLNEFLKQETGSDHDDFIDLLTFTLPSSYLENFRPYYSRALVEVKKMTGLRIVFFCRVCLFNPTALVLLSLRGSFSRVTYQHGGHYGQAVPTWSEVTEKEVATHFLTWGYRHSRVDIPFVSLNFSRPWRVSAPGADRTLVVLPIVSAQGFRWERLKSSLDILERCLGDESSLHLRFHPRQSDIAAATRAICSRGLKVEVDRDTRQLRQVAQTYANVIFLTAFGTGYLELLNEGYCPKMVFSLSFFEIRPESREAYELLKACGVWIDETNTSQMSLEPPTNEQKAACERFRSLFAQASYFPHIRLIGLLLSLAWRRAVQEFSQKPD